MRLALYTAVIIAFGLGGCRENGPASAAQVLSVLPNRAAPTMLVKISGTNFSSIPSENTVKFNGMDGKVLEASGTELTVEVPKGGTTGNITVSSQGATSIGPDFQYIDMKIVFNEWITLKVWNNGEVETWADPSRTSFGYAATRKGDDLYVAGSFYVGGIKPCYWKNKVETPLPTDGFAMTSDIAIAGNDIYISGYDLTTPVKKAIYWKNGVSISLTGLSQGDETTSSIEISGGDIYVGGAVTNQAGKQVAAYWKNGTLHEVSDGTLSTTVKDILVNGNDIHLLLEEYSPTGLHGGISIIYLKNSEVFRLTNGSAAGLFSGAGRMLMANSKVYIPGYDNKDVKNYNVARLWIDGVRSDLVPGELFTRATWVGVVGEDVIVGGVKTETTSGVDGSSIFFMVNETKTLVSAKLPFGLVGLFVAQPAQQ